MKEEKEKRYSQVQVKLDPIVAKRILTRLKVEGDMGNGSDKILVQCFVPERLAWRIKRLIGPNSIHALAAIFLYQFSKGESVIENWQSPKTKPLNKLLKDFLKGFAVGKARLVIGFESPEQDLKKVA